MKNLAKLFGIIAIAALIGFSMVACDDDPYYGDGYTGSSGSGSLSGTYYWYDWYIIFRSNGTFTGNDGDSTTNGSYRVSGSTIALSPRFYGNTWTIIDSNTVMDDYGDRWRK